MNTPSRHPSFLELDRFALGVPRSAETEAHVARCAGCREHLARVRPAELVPGWVGALPAKRRSVPTALWGGLSVAAALCLMWLGLRAPEREYDTVKGGPDVGVYVHREGATTLWDGASLRPYDRIRLEVTPEEFDHVAVFGLGATGSLALLYQGRIHPHLRQILPKAWELDERGDVERLVVMFSKATISPGAAERLLGARDPAQVHVVRLALPKRQP